uniref:Uncharacterized protein n=1 Tax=Spongospora subterranea TaxID=70186 RepID=A0A0H5QGA9_9EUKA|eukprot:CRZ01093.1 hypothetical protein [Spongospora subterranea]
MVSEHSSADVAVPVELDCVSTLSGHTDVVWCVAWHPGQDLVLASCGSDKTIRIWKQVGRDHQKQWVCFATVATGHKRTIRCLAWSPDGSMLASGGFDGIVNIWSLVESTDDGSDDESQPTYSIVATLEGHENEVKSLSWSSCAHPFLLATCSRDKSVWIWELQGVSFLWTRFDVFY